MEGRTHPLRAWRKNRKPPLTQEKAVDILGVPEPTISRIENWKRTPSLTLAAKLSEKTGIPIDSFVKQTEAAE